MDSVSLQSSSGGDDGYASVTAASLLPPPFDPLSNYFIDSTSLLFDPFSPVPASTTPTTVTTTSTTTTTTTTQLKNPRKRSRASRRAPTTVLTTDTNNFRAMVQEFTGIPVAPFSSSPFDRARINLYGGPSCTGSGPSEYNYNPVLNFRSLLEQTNAANDQRQVRGDLQNLVSSEGKLGSSEKKGGGSENMMGQWICSSVNR